MSFGPQGGGIDLKPLNVLVGPNGSGKSNLIEAINFLRASPSDWRDVTRRGGGVQEWVWKGDAGGTASIDTVLSKRSGSSPLRHSISFRVLDQAFSLDDERVEEPERRDLRKDVFFYYRYQGGHPVVSAPGQRDGRRGLARETIETGRSILAQRRDPDAYPELSWLAQNYERVRIYREWAFGRNAVFREPQKADLRNDVLEEDFSNLGLVLNRLQTLFPHAKKAIIEGLTDLYDGFTDFNVLIQGGTVQVFFTEGRFSIPATRLSDGTLRYLCLLTILCHPEPAPLICLEEPELGLHPDILPKLADHLVAASKTTQLIVTTHSDILIDALSDTPESVVVCSKKQGQTALERLDPAALQDWLASYKLGELWTRGDIGGTRW